MIKAEDIMTRTVVTISGSATVAEAATVMKDKKLRALIVDRRSEDDPYGMVSETDIIYKVAAYGYDPKKIRVYKSDFIEKPKRLFIEDQIEAAREEAREVCAAKGGTAPECAAAWDVVEELQAEASDRRAEGKKQDNASSSLEIYCQDNPSASECRIYED